MSDKKGFMGLAALAAAGAGAAMLMKKTKEINEEETFHVKETTENYRNTERGKYDKNSKGIYYSNGNYEAFARPEKPEGVDDKHAYIVGSGLASLAAASWSEMHRCPGTISTSWKPWTLPAVPAMEFLIRPEVISCVAAVRWKIISNVSGIFSTAFLPSKNQALLFWMNFTG